MSTSDLVALRHPPEAVMAFVRQLIESNRSQPNCERRINPRETISIPACVQPLDQHFAPNGDAFSMVTKSLSTGGFGFVHSAEVFERYVQVDFSAPSVEAMPLVAKIRHCTRCGEFYQIGARFVVDWSLCSGVQPVDRVDSSDREKMKA